MGIDANKFEVDHCFTDNATVCPENDVFFSNGASGLHNLTSVMQAPVFNTKRHFLDCTPNVPNSVKVLTKDGKEIKPNKELDDTTILVEKYSGTTLSVVLNL